MKESKRKERKRERWKRQNEARKKKKSERIKKWGNITEERIEIRVSNINNNKNTEKSIS